MARRRGYMATYAQYQRQAQRDQAARERAQRQAIRDAEHAQRAYEHAVATNEKEKRRLYQESMLARAAAMTDDVETTARALESLLAASLTRPSAVDFAQLRREPVFPSFEPGQLGQPEQPPRPSDFAVAPPTGLRSHFGKAKAKYAEELERARQTMATATAEYERREQTRLGRVALARAMHEKLVTKIRAEAEKHNAEVAKLQADYSAAAPEALRAYNALVLDQSPYPEGFPRETRLAFVPESRQLVVELDLPGADIVPTVTAYRYVRASDEISSAKRPEPQRRSLYSSVVAQVTLRTVHEIFGADVGGHIDTLVFNGHVSTIDPGTGQPIHPCLVTLRVTKDAFASIDLSRVDPTACLKALNAGVSKSPAELAPVRPVLEFSMVDPRFIEETDIISELDQRPNLMELKPSEFESLITNLFEKMGLETRQTRPSRDGGVDCVAYDPRPVLGGKVVIQAKRYKNTVGVSAVRDLFGTVHNEGASKGILVTTSGYGKASFEFAEGKPLELLGGSNLLYMLAEYAGIEARIEAPDDWKDPTAFEEDI